MHASLAAELPDPRGRRRGGPLRAARAHLTLDFDDLLAWTSTRMDKSAVAKLTRVSCNRGTGLKASSRVNSTPLVSTDSVASASTRVSWKKQHKYLTLVVDHDEAKVVGGVPGKDAATLDKFFDELGPQRSQRIEAVSMDLAPAFLKSVSAEGHAPQAIICADPFHLVKLVGDTLDVVRRELWQELRRLPDDRFARDFKGSRWALLKNPDNLTERQQTQLAALKRNRGGIWRAYERTVPGHLRWRPHSEGRY